MREWLLENRISHVTMENTGVYWKPVYDVPEHSGLICRTVNASHIKHVQGHKTNRKADRQASIAVPTNTCVKF
ncbi:MAG: hypothetical protein LBH32_08025 [Dysgonamonadaceae bacterium]|nr:hypothetical protein [Dysgonamonadaceae bacterium]